MPGTSRPLRPWRYWPHVERSGPVPLARPDLGPCWVWRGAHNRKGYAVYSGSLAHRAAYRLANGDVPDGCEIDHLCRNRGCVNPGHLEAVTHRVNIDRAKRPGCRNGHVYEPDSYYVRPNGSKTCKACAATAKRRSRNQTTRRTGHRIMLVEPGCWICKCGALLGSSQSRARDAMRLHRQELWEADRAA